MEENEERTLYENLEYLNETKGIIKQAIIDKGVEISADTPFREYADKIGDIQGGGQIVNIYDASIDGNTLVLSDAPELPYIPLEYIQSTGTQWLDTNYVSANKFKFKLACSIKNTTGQKVLGAENIISGSYFMLYSSGYNGVVGKSGVEGRYGTGSVYNTITIFNNSNITDVIYEFIANDKIIYAKYYSNETLINQVSVDTSVINSIVGSSLKLFSGGKYSSERATSKIYYFKIYDDNILVRDLIPAKRKSDNEVCLYDKITQQFFINQGTGSFIAGPEKE